VVFTTFLKENDAVYNATVLAKAGTIKALYKKIHLFDAFGYQESAIFTAGNQLAIADLGSLRMGLAVCFDLRFPEIFRIMAYKGVNLFIVPSGWYNGEYKIEQWRALVATRAHENVSYLVAADQTSPSFIGHSTVISPFGYALKELNNEQASFSVELDFEEIRKARRLLPTILLAKRDLYHDL
jgi:predicted amidohydrolase